MEFKKHFWIFFIIQIIFTVLFFMYYNYNFKYNSSTTNENSNENKETKTIIITTLLQNSSSVAETTSLETKQIPIIPRILVNVSKINL